MSETVSQPIKAYKAFDKNMTCLGLKYEVGKTYKTEDNIRKDGRGFEAYKNPFEVLEDYKLTLSRFAEVELSGTITMNEFHTKFCASTIKIVRELSLEEFIQEGINCIGDVSNDDCQIVSRDDKAQIASSGYYAQIASSGYYAQILSSGIDAQILSSGDSAQIASSGYCADITSIGNFAEITSNGDSAQIFSNGDSAQINSDGKYSVVYCASNNSMAKAKKGSWITLCEWVHNDNAERYIPTCVKTEYVDGERIKEDTWYKLIDGKFTEVEG